MGINPNKPPNDPPCNTIAYRLALKKGWIDLDDPTRANAEAFARRRPKIKPDGEPDPGDEDGLSVLDSFFWADRQQCIEANAKSCYGIITVHVGRLLDLGLTVIRDPKDLRKLLITNVPFERPESVEENDLLDDVAKTARVCMTCKYRRKDK
jgi:hypothetical protein